MPAFTASQASVTNNSKVVQINSGESIANVNSGDFLVLAGFIIEINRAYLGGDGKGYFELVKNWPNSNQTNQECIVIPTTGEFKKAVEALASANVLVNDNFKAMQDWQTKTGTVTFSNQDGTTTTVKTLKQIEADNLAQMNAYHPYPWAMRKVEFEQLRKSLAQTNPYSGFIEKGNRYASGKFLHQGLMVTSDEAIALGYSGGNPFEKGVKPYAEICIANINTELVNLSTPYASYGALVSLPPPESGLRTYDSATGENTNHNTTSLAFASESATNKVLKARKDTWGFEGFLREITSNDPFVYKNGLIQSQSPDIDGVATTLNNTRPIEYFAWFNGDTANRGKGVNWLTATDEQRRKIASNIKNKIFFDDDTGSWHQWCVRGCSFLGATNEDWTVTDSGSPSNVTFSPVNGFPDRRIAPQGNSDIRPQKGDFSNYYAATRSDYNDIPFPGIFTARNSANISSNIGCFFLYCGSVNRLNTGLFHPTLNEFGTALASDNKDWSLTSVEFATAEDCFDSTKLLAGSGSVSSGKSGRSDGRYYDAVYTNGHGGICEDARYKTQKVVESDYLEALRKIKVGEFRGQQQLEKVTALVAAQAETSGSVGYLTVSSSPELEAFFGTSADGVAGNRGNWYSIPNVTLEVFDKSKGVKYFASHYWSQTSGKFMVGLSLTGTDIQTPLPTELLSASGNELIFVKKQKTGLTVSGEYLHTVVIGEPSEIMQCDELKNGWVGDYVPLPPSATTQIKMPRPIVSVTEKPRYYTQNYGETWTNVTAAPDLTLGTMFSNTANVRNGVEIYQYITRAKPVKHSPRLPMLGGSKAIQNVWFCSWGSIQRGSSLVHGLIDKIPTGSSSYSRTAEVPLNKISIDNVSRIFPAANTLSEHIDPQLEGVSSPAVKALPYWSYDSNKKAVISFSFTELVNKSGTDWGDDGKIYIAENLSTMLDDNVKTVFVGTAVTTESLGHI